MYALPLYKLPILVVVAACFVCAQGLTAALVAITIRVCGKQGWVCKPRTDRWHKGSPAFFGGVPLWAGFTLASIVFVPWSNHLLWRLLGLATFMFLLGLIDDVYQLRPRAKFSAQLAIAVALVAMGVIYPLRGNLIVNILVSLVWIVGITNAFNLLDNMDGLAAGIALISACYLTVFYVIGDQREHAMLVALAAGAIGGFLLFNFNPARIFMGDSGSLFLGFLLGAASLLDVTHVSGVPAFVLAPVVVLAIPIFDTLFVSVTRRLRGRPISQGGTDHSSHRLVRFGLHERSAVLLLYALSAGSGAVALLARNSSLTGSSGVTAFWFFLLLLFGVHLFQGDQTAHIQSGSNGFEHHPHHLLTRDTLIFLLDPLALALSYYLAYILRFRGDIPAGDLSQCVRSLPIVVAIKVASLALCRTFRHSWWRGSVSDIYRLGFATLIGEGLSVLTILAFYRFEGYSRTVFVLDAILAWGCLLAVRRSFPLFRDTLYNCRSTADAQKRVFILGTSGHAELALRFLRDRSIECAGFIDTNGGADLRRYVFGRPVLGRLDDLAGLARQHGIFEVVLPESEVIPFSDADFQSFCDLRQLRLTKLGFYGEGQPNGLPTSAQH